MKRKDSRGKGLSCANHAKAEARVPGKRDVLTGDSRGTSGTWNTQNPRGSRGMHSNQASTGLQPEAGFSLGSRQLCSQREGGRDTEGQRNACNPPLHTCTSEGATLHPESLQPCSDPAYWPRWSRAADQQNQPLLSSLCNSVPSSNQNTSLKPKHAKWIKAQRDRFLKQSSQHLLTYLAIPWCLNSYSSQCFGGLLCLCPRRIAARQQSSPSL